MGKIIAKYNKLDMKFNALEWPFYPEGPVPFCST